jgi:hypothetical protein
VQVVAALRARAHQVARLRRLALAARRAVVRQRHAAALNVAHVVLNSSARRRQKVPR